MDNTTPFFSIIIPVYNAYTYIGKAIESILEQTYTNFELIIVDDCSKDNSLMLCNEYATKDARIKVLKNDTNSGASVARNKGLDNALGKYCGFVDADDYIDQGLLETVYEALSVSNADMLKFGVFEEYYSDKGDLVNCQKFTPGNFTLNDEEDIKAKAVELELVPLFGYMWNSFYKNTIYDSTKKLVRLNPDIRINEDFDYNIRFLSNVKCMQGIDFCAYHYAKRVNNSLSTKKNDMYLRDHMRKISNFVSLYGSVNAMTIVIRRNVFWLYTRYVFSALERSSNDETREKMWKDIKTNEMFSLFETTSFSEMPIKIRIMTTLLKSKNLKLITKFAKFITITKKYAPILFSLIKR